MEKELKSGFVVAVFMLFGVLLLPSCNKGGTASSSGNAVPTGKLTVTPQYGDEIHYPKPATGWTANTAYPKQPPISGVNEFPITSGKTSMKVSIPYFSYVTDYEENDLTKYMEELTNIHIEWNLLPEVNPLEKVNLMFAAGDTLPDVFFNCYFPSTMLITLGSQGLISVCL